MTSYRETADDYAHVVCVDGRTRVIADREDIQWIIQRWNGYEWRSRYFCRSRQGLELYFRPSVGGSAGLIAALPEWYADGGREGARAHEEAQVGVLAIPAASGS